MKYIYIYQQTKAISRKSKMNNTKGNKMSSPMLMLSERFLLNFLDYQCLTCDQSFFHFPKQHLQG